MPIYTLKDIDTQETWDVNCTYSELLRILQDPKIEQVLLPPKILGSRDGSVKVPDGFKDLKKRIKGNSGAGNTIK